MRYELREHLARELHALIADCDHSRETFRPWQCRMWADRLIDAIPALSRARDDERETQERLRASTAAPDTSAPSGSAADAQPADGSATAGERTGTV